VTAWQLAVALAIDGSRLPARSSSNVPTNVEALREYLEGLGNQQLGGLLSYPSAATHYLAAARLDSTYTAPLVSAAFALSTLERYGREDERAAWTRQRDSVLQILERRKTRLTRVDREGLAFFKAVSRGDLIAMRRAAGLAASLSPGSEWSCQAARLASAQALLPGGGRVHETNRF
jgi:hypothetical protein